MDVLAPERLLDRARAIGRELLNQAQQVEDGSISWGRGFDVDLVPVPDAGIFNGRSGEALFFAALHAATAETEFKQASLRALHTLRSGLATDRYGPSLANRVGLGLMGIGSIVYALVRIGRFLGRPELLDDARRAALAITPDAISRDRKYEVCWGSAGALLGLLALADAGDQGALEQAAQCAEHLLTTRVLDPQSGRKAWATFADIPWAGFAHGSTGIAHALLQVHARTGERRYYDAAIEAFTFERSLYREDVQDWPDCRDQPADRIMSGWCHGATGVGFSRLCALPVVRPADEPDVVSDLSLALKKVSSGCHSGPDNLCCGAVGRIDFLLEAGRRLDDEALTSRALSMARGIVAHLVQHEYRPLLSDEAHLGPGLWQGLAGVGYGLLRLAKPDAYPCILILA